MYFATAASTSGAVPNPCRYRGLRPCRVEEPAKVNEKELVDPLIYRILSEDIGS